MHVPQNYWGMVDGGQRGNSSTSRFTEENAFLPTKLLVEDEVGVTNEDVITGLTKECE